MAVPDPYMNEINLMSYEPRNRACKDLHKVPRKGDYIEVLWLIDNVPGMPMRWCPAEVLHVFGSPDQECLAKGAIRYLPGETWEQQFDFVDFMHGFKVRCSVKEGEEEEAGQDSSGTEDPRKENPCLEWRFTQTPGSLTDQSDSDSDDGSWCIGNPDDESAKRRRTLSSVQSNGDTRNWSNADIRALRAGHAALVVEVEKVKRELVTMSKNLATVIKSEEHGGRCSSAACVLPRLRHKLALKLQGGLRHVPKPARKKRNNDPDQDLSICYVDGFLPGVIRARVECTLRQFERVSRHVRACSDPDTVFFFPDFSYTQLPLQCSLEFRILFKTFSHLCDIIGIVSTSDKKEMARKCGNGPKGEVLRFLGTYCYDAKDEQKSAHFFPGTSCGDSAPQQFDHYASNTENITGSTEKADPLFPVLTRRTREWNKVDGRYRYKLQKGNVPLPLLTAKCGDTNAFTMMWKRTAELGGRGWSEAMCDPGEVFGWIEICIPFVQTVGKLRCQELGGVGNDDMWDALLRMDKENST